MDIREWFLIGLENNWLSLQSIPQDMRTEDMYGSALERGLISLADVPFAYRTRKLCMAGVEHQGWELSDVPLGMRDREMCLMAVKADGMALAWVPETLCDHEICLEAVKNNGLALREVPLRCKNDEICATALKGNGEALEWLLEDRRTPEFCRMAVESNGMALAFVPEALKTEELCTIAVQRDSSALRCAKRCAPLCEGKIPARPCKKAPSQTGGEPSFIQSAPQAPCRFYLRKGSCGAESFRQENGSNVVWSRKAIFCRNRLWVFMWQTCQCLVRRSILLLSPKDFQVRFFWHWHFLSNRRQSALDTLFPSFRTRPGERSCRRFVQ